MLTLLSFAWLTLVLQDVLPIITSSGSLSDFDSHTLSVPSLSWFSLYSHSTYTFINHIIYYLCIIKSCMKLECKEDYFGKGEGNLETVRPKLC